MPAGNAYPSGHLVPSPILGLANAPIVETKFLEIAMSLLDFSPRIPLGTFSILPYADFPKEMSISTNVFTSVLICIFLIFNYLLDIVILFLNIRFRIWYGFFL